MLAAAIFALVLMADAPATAGGTEVIFADQRVPDPVPVVTPPVTPASADDKVVCVSEEVAGSIIKKRVCATKAEWKRRRERDRQTATDTLDTQTASSSRGRE